MKLALARILPHEEDWQAASTYVVEAERLGVDQVWSGEGWGLDAATPLAYFAAKTSRIRLGTGILQTVARTPANVAMTALSLTSMSSGRFLLGFGVSGPQVVEGWHGVRFTRPLQRLRELIEVVRIITGGGVLTYRGEIFEMPLPGGEGKALRVSARPRPDIPVYLAALGPRALELTGEIAQGWLGASFMPEHADVFLPYIARGAEKAGRSLSDIDITVACAVEFSDDVDALVDRYRSQVAFSLGGMGSRQHNFYNMAFRRADFEEEAIAVQRKWLEGDREQATALVPDEMVLNCHLLGTESMIRERLRMYEDAGVNTLRLQIDGQSLSKRLETLGLMVALVRELKGKQTNR